MAYEQRNNSGSAFTAKEKKSETHADLTGSGLIDGKEYWINVWKKKDKNGDTYLSFGFNPKKPMADKGGAPQKSSKTPFDDNIDF
jgi:hypothetical protein